MIILLNSHSECLFILQNDTFNVYYNNTMIESQKSTFLFKLEYERKIMNDKNEVLRGAANGRSLLNGGRVGLGG